jgi:hypothetical protein
MRNVANPLVSSNYLQTAKAVASSMGLWCVLDAWSGSRGVDPVVAAFMLAASRRSVSAPSDDRIRLRCALCALLATSETSGEMTGSTAFASARVPVGFLWMLVPGRSFRARACRTRPFRGDRPFVVNRTPDEAPSSVSLGSSGQFSLPARTWPAIRSPSGLKT